MSVELPLLFIRFIPSYINRSVFPSNCFSSTEVRLRQICRKIPPGRAQRSPLANWFYGQGVGGGRASERARLRRPRPSRRGGVFTISLCRSPSRGGFLLLTKEQRKRERQNLRQSLMGKCRSHASSRRFSLYPAVVAPCHGAGAAP